VGDAVLATPLLAPLKARYPDASIDIVCWTAARAVFQGNTGVNGIFSSPMFDAEGFGGLMGSISATELRKARAFLKGADLFLFLNRICTIGGFLKYWLISFLGGNGVKAGLDTDGRGIYLDVRVTDPGFLVKHEVEFARDVLEAVGCVVPLERMRVHVHIGEGEKTHVTSLLAGHPIRDFVVLHPGSSLSGWRALKRIDQGVWRIFVQRILSEYRLPVMLVGSGEDDGINRELMRDLAGGAEGIPVLNLAGRTTLPQLAELISRAILFVGTDSGVAHIASCTDTPSITVFGFSDFIGYAPWGRNSQVLSTHADCAPCLYWKGYLSCGHRKCLEISPDDLYRKAAEILDEAGRSRFPGRGVDRTGK
jgi:ADP-heptose:LPS heptosyltransferase